MAAPPAVLFSMLPVFHALRERCDARAAYNTGFAIYWAGWCYGFPLAILGPRRALRVLIGGATPGGPEWVALLFPVVGAAATELWPNRRKVNPTVVALMIGSAAVNAVGEELLWRGLFIEEFPDDLLRGIVWPLAGFSLWHLAPQLILPSRLGRWRFVLGATVVGAASALTVWRGRGLRWAIASHLLTDACGVRVARFRLGR